MSTIWHPRIADNIDELLSGPIALVDQFALLQKSSSNTAVETSAPSATPPGPSSDLTISQVVIPSQEEQIEAEATSRIRLQIQHGGHPEF